MVEIIAYIVGGAFGIVLTALGTVIAWNLQAIKNRLASQDGRIEQIERAFASCKQNCFQTFVEKEDWLREAGNNRIKLDEISTMLNQIIGKLSVTEKLPEIAGSIAKNIVAEMKG